MDKRIYLCLAHMSGKEMGFIQEAFDTNWVVPLGPNVSGFEQDLEAFVGENKHVVALSAGTAAVHLALVPCVCDAFGIAIRDVYSLIMIGLILVVSAYYEYRIFQEIKSLRK